MNHESLQRNDAVGGSSNRTFGLTFGAVFLVLGLYPWVFGGHLRLWSFAVSSGFVLLSLLMPGVLGPFNKVWTGLGLALHKITSPILLGVIFFLVITPLGLLMRLLHKDILKLKMDRAAASYWVDRLPPGPKADTLENQF